MAQDFQAELYTASSNTNYVSVAYDYSDHLNLLNDLVERIAIAVETISTDLATIKADISTIKDKQTLMEEHLDTMQSVVEDISVSDTEERESNSEFVAGPHVRQINTTWYNDERIGNRENRRLSRGMMMVNLKETDRLDDVRDEVDNPTPL